VWAVYAREIDYSPEVKSPIEWMLLTTVEVSTFLEAVERLAWYARRWGIEVYHRTLKSGCRVEDRRLNNVDRIEACLAIDLVVAWRIYWLTKQGRETPDISCDNFLSEDETEHEGWPISNGLTYGYKSAPRAGGGSFNSCLF
jgi:hypothetical protein